MSKGGSLVKYLPVTQYGQTKGDMFLNSTRASFLHNFYDK